MKALVLATLAMIPTSDGYVFVRCDKGHCQQITVAETPSVAWVIGPDGQRWYAERYVNDYRARVCAPQGR